MEKEKDTDRKRKTASSIPANYISLRKLRELRMEEERRRKQVEEPNKFGETKSVSGVPIRSGGGEDSTPRDDLSTKERTQANRYNNASRSLTIQNLTRHGNMEEALHEYYSTEDDDLVSQVIRLSLASQKEDELIRLAMEESMKDQHVEQQVSLSHESAIEEKETGGFLRGMVNVGNSCYVNSVLQCLIRTKPLIKMMREHNFSVPCNCGGNTFCCQDSLKTLMDDMLLATRKPIKPDSFTSNLEHFHLRPFVQEDVHAFLVAFWDKLAICSVDPQASAQLQKKNNIVHSVFGGTISRVVCCSQCRATYEMKEDCLGYSLEVAGVDTIFTALDSFTGAETTEGTCDYCKQKVSQRIDYKLGDLPRVATFHLKKFAFNRSKKTIEKIMHPLSFPTVLDLGPYISQRENNKEVSTYRLYGFVVHSGTTVDSGHYYAFASSDL